VEKRLLKTWGEGCGRSLAFQIIVMAAAFSLFLIPALAISLWGGDRDTNFGIFMGILILGILAGIAGTVIWGVSGIRKRAAHLDAIFEPWGLEGSAYLQNGRQYHGEINHHQVKIYFRRGPTLEIQIAAPLNTRAVVVFKSELGRISAELTEYESLVLNDPLFHHLSIYALDANWMNKILADDPGRKAIRTLMRVSGVQELRQIFIQPEALKLIIRRVRINEINQQNVETWIDEMLTLLQTLKHAPNPQEITVAIPILQESHLDRKSITILAAMVGFTTLAALSVCIIAISVVLRVLASILSQ